MSDDAVISLADYRRSRSKRNASCATDVGTTAWFMTTVLAIAEALRNQVKVTREYN